MTFAFMGMRCPRPHGLHVDGRHRPARFSPRASRHRSAAQETDLIFKKSTVFKWLTPNDKLAIYGIDDPVVEGVACHYTQPERGG